MTIEKDLNEIITKALQCKLEEVAPNFKRKNTVTEYQIEKIIRTISLNLVIPEEKVYIAIILLFLQGAASAGAPMTMSVDLGSGKCVEKRNLIDACMMVTGHKFIRRIAETIAVQIGTFAYSNRLIGELGLRISNKLKAETGESLDEKELAFCSSFSQAIPNLSEITSERLSRLLAEDYQRRFEGKTKKKYESIKGQSYLQKKNG